MTSSWAISFQGRFSSELAAEPGGQGVGVDLALLHLPAQEGHLPLGREILGVVGVAEQVLDELGPLVAFFIRILRLPLRLIGALRKALASRMLGIRPRTSR